MRIPEPLQPLHDEGVIQEVIRPLMSGKEAQIYLVIAGGIRCVAKVYKEAEHRSFRNRADYTEGRKVRNSRQQRAMDKGSRYGKEQVEQAWRSAEVDAIYRLRAAGVRVPEPYTYVDGVLVMELVCDAEGEPAPRMADLAFTAEEAEWLFHHLVREVCRMLCAGVIHGDLSDFNVLMSADGPVIIDFPQATDPAHNNNARKLLIRDVNNLTSFLERYAPVLRGTKYGEEMWDMFERGVLVPESPLTGRFRKSDRSTDVEAILREIEHAEREARARREALGLPPPRLARTPVVSDAPPPRPAPPGKGGKGRPGGDGRRDDRGPRGDAPRPEDRGAPRGDAPRGDGERRDRGGDGGRPPRDRGFDGPPSDRPPRGFDGPPRDRPPRDRGFDGPPSDRPPRDRGFDGPPSDRPPRGFDGPPSDRPPRDRGFDGHRSGERADRGAPDRRSDGPRPERPPRDRGGERGFDGPRREDRGFDGPRPAREERGFDAPRPADRPPREDRRGQGDRRDLEGGRPGGDRPPGRGRDDRGPRDDRRGDEPRGAWVGEGGRPSRDLHRGFDARDAREPRPPRAAGPPVDRERPAPKPAARAPFSDEPRPDARPSRSGWDDFDDLLKIED